MGFNGAVLGILVLLMEIRDKSNSKTKPASIKTQRKSLS